MSESPPTRCPLPQKDKLIVVRDTPEQETASGLVIPTQAQQRPATGIVKAQGPEVTSSLVGARVAFNAFAGTEINYQGTDYLILREVDILCELP